MAFTQGLVEVDSLRLTQLYLSKKKMDAIEAWFSPSLKNFGPIPVHSFDGGQNLYITDGHTRTYVAWKRGLTRIPCVYDDSDIVTCALGQIQYKIDVEWCERFGLTHIKKLENRILSGTDYALLWQGRCEKMYDMVCALEEQRLSEQLLRTKETALRDKGLYVYGISSDLKTLCCEDRTGKLYEIPLNGR